MAERELSIIREARITLNDVTTSPRWTDERLMELLSNAQDDMCRNIPMIVNKATINTTFGVEEYNLPNDCIKLLVATSNAAYADGTAVNRYRGNTLTVSSYDEIDRNNPEWESDYSNYYSHLITNALSQQVIRPYPLLAEGAVAQPINIRYSAMPIQLGWDEDLNDSVEELSTNVMWDYGLKQYIISMAFLDYGDASSISRADVALKLYQKEYVRAEKLARKSFAKRVVTTDYQAKVSSNTDDGRNGGSNNSYYRR